MARFSVGWTVAALLIVPFTTPRWGALGFVVGTCIAMVAGNALLLVVVLKTFPMARIWPRVRAPLVGAIAVGVLGKWVLSGWALGALSFTASIVVEAGLFSGLVLLLDRSLMRDVLTVIRTAKS
jgi:hypothetical protein